MKLSQIIANYKDTIKGGKGDKTDPATLDKQELAVGIAVEKEHSSSIEQALEIAVDHITENSRYYHELIASGIVDEKQALDLAKKFGWTMGESFILNKTTLSRIIDEEIRKLI